MPPKAEIIYLNDFNLKDLETTFTPAKFERRTSKNKIHKIANAMIENKFIDNVIRVVNSTSVTYDIIDGQHRVEALHYAREYFGLETYDLIVFCYQGGNQREIYRRLNLGKPLTLADHLKALDNGKLKFFNELRDYCVHYRAVGSQSYATILNCLHYAKSTSIRTVRTWTVDDFLQAVTPSDLKKIQLFIPLLDQIATNPESQFYRYTIMRNFFRIYYENKLSEKNTIELGKELLKSFKVKELAEKRDTFAMRGIYHYIIDIAAPKVGLTLAKGEVKK